jgi:cytochrome b
MKGTRILVWDLPVRMFHWLLVASFAGAFMTAESERVRDIHVALGYTFVGLLAFRLLWGLVGSRYARFSSFAFGPKAVLAYLRSLLARRPERHVGHNPAGSWVIYALLVLGLTVGATGHSLHVDDGHWLEELHEGVANALLALAFFHVAGAVISSFLHRENLVAAMVTGYKSGSSPEGIGRTRWHVAAALAAALAVLGAAGSQVTGSLPDSVTTMRHDAERAEPSPARHRGHDG